MDAMKLASGYEIPCLGIGTYTLLSKKCSNMVKEGLAMGYRHIDTAVIFNNHKAIGRGMIESGVPREDIFVTSKLWFVNLDYQSAMKQTNNILNELRTDYLDLLLIHWPTPAMPVKAVLQAMDEMVDNGTVRSIGISNFNIATMHQTSAMAEVPLSVNQVEYHPLMNQELLLDACLKDDIVLTGYSPLARGKVFRNATLQELAADKGISVAQLSLSWLLSKGIVAIPKASSTGHLKENLQSLEITLSDDEIDEIDNLGIFERQIQPDFYKYKFDY